MVSLPTVDLEVGATLHGFEVVAIDPVPEVRSVAVRLEHAATGARVMHLVNDDAENLFSVAFPTPPSDDTGVPHILEHMVLAGSKRFPVRDPFFEMCKSSMATFINAMTAWDCTYYPVTSNVRQDLANLAEVYFDAVFHPLLTEDTFKREGHHLAPRDPADPTGALTVTGIVYNEMKGAFSDPESRLYRIVGRALFPDTLYAHESGGDPESIPDLTYDDLKRFHATWYHPSNAYFVLYGDVPTEEHLAFLDARLAGFSRQAVEPGIAPQPRWTAPRKIDERYAIGRDESTAEKTFIVMNWLVGDATDPFDSMADYILAQLLHGHEGSPLKRAVIASKLGQDICFAGFGSVGLESNFLFGIKGSEPDRAAAFETLVLDTLGELADKPFDAEDVEAALQQASYHHLEISQQYPLGCMNAVLGAWIYGRSSLTFLDSHAQLEAVRAAWQRDPMFFGKRLRARVIANPHRVTVVMAPDPGWQARQDAAFETRMANERTAIDDAAALAIAEEAARLQALAGTPNTPEQLATLPQLAVADLPPEPDYVHARAVDLGHGATLLRGDVFTNGVNYLRLSFDLRGIDADLVPWLTYYAEAVRKMGAAGLGFEAVARRKAESTGEFGCSTSISGHLVDPDATVIELSLSIKTLDRTVDRALGVLHDVLFSVDPRDRDRLREIVVQKLARYRSAFVDNGSATAAIHAARYHDAAGALSHALYGLPQLERCETIHGAFDEGYERIVDRVEAVRAFVLSSGRLVASFNGSDAAGAAVEKALREWAGSMAHASLADARPAAPSIAVPPRDGLAGAMQVAYCAALVPAPHAVHPDAMACAVGAHMLNMDYLINEVRFKGNAYGAWCRYSGTGRSVALGSYRDPHVARTLGVFDGLEAFVRDAPWTQDDVDRAIIGIAKRYVMPIRPHYATNAALQQHLLGDSPELRARYYAALRAVRVDDVRRAWVELLEAGRDRTAVCVVSSREKLEAANETLGERALAIVDILEHA